MAVQIQVAPTTVTLEEALTGRRSVRGFLPDPVPREVLERVFEWAQRTPSNCNIQPWKVFVASGAARDRIRAKLMERVMSGQPSQPDYDYPGKFEGEYRKRQVDCAVAMYSAMGIARDDSAGRAKASLRNFELFDAPHVAFIGMHKSFGTTVGLDVGMYAQSLMLAMHAHGIASCAQGSMRYYPDAVREEFPGNDDIGILFGISFGYEDPRVPANATRTVREPISSSVFFKEE
jgi:nitroreductase